MDNITIVVLAAGLGTRMKSRKAKVLHQAGGLTLIEHVAAAAAAVAPPERIAVVVGHQAELVEAAVAGRGVRFALQRDQRGTGHAVVACRELLEPMGGDVVILLGDCPLLSPATIESLVAAQRGSSAAATVITTVLEDPSAYGRIVRAPDGSVAAIVEHKAATPAQRAIREINSGIYCFRGDLLWRHLDEIGTDNPAREYYLTDIVEILRRHGHRVAPLLIEDSSELLGINTRAELAQVDSILRARKVRQVMLDGVTVEKPETVTIDAGVEIGCDTVIEPFARILGRSAIGEDCRIGACSIVRDSELAGGVEILPFTSIDSSRVDRGARVGPFARLRQNARVKGGARVGNFVEMKNAELGEGAKSQHLAYLGDATIGDRANVGAGTITCNYDGARKHRTTIGPGAFIGSNSTLVAPIEIGEGSYVAAGSVITDPVPADALALGRGRQVNKEGWAKKRRETRAK
ncbi:MAG: bifunctional UDP-N-acetylglucosamine diphosphorylase/glucosamine-1-phosphate N-acetyltransferase GlmU [Bryobacteraceae bacterium]|jgi:bifunctional UDP-N-acetylglucosamine pyrophosphorylase/glucosamine-1-phosphate N-acetyltransferase